MHFGESIALLLAVTAAVILLRAYWHRMPRRLEKAIFLAGAIAVTLRAISVVTFWTTVSPRINSVICWLSVIAYELILVRFSLMRPRWLTAPCAIILLLPIFGSTLLFPLTGIFDTSPPHRTPIAQNYHVERSPWDPKMSGQSGEDYGLYSSPSWLPFLHRIVQRSSFSQQQCRSVDVTVSIDRQRHLVYFHCPGHQGSQSDVDLALPLK